MHKAHRSARTRVGLTAATVGTVAALVLTAAVGLPAAQATGSTTTKASTAWGGGTSTSVAYAPGSSTLVALGGDTSGVHISTNDGAHWVTANANMDLTTTG